MATLFDVRLCRQSAKRFLHVSDPRGAYVATVHALTTGLRPVPDCDAIRAALPGNLRKAFDRAGGFWFDKYDATKPASMTLTSTRGALIGTLYATQYEL